MIYGTRSSRTMLGGPATLTNPGAGFLPVWAGSRDRDGRGMARCERCAQGGRQPALIGELAQQYRPGVADRASGLVRDLGRAVISWP